MARRSLDTLETHRDDAEFDGRFELGAAALGWFALGLAALALLPAFANRLDDPLAPESPGEASRRLRSIVAARGVESWIVLGDSVVAGRVADAHGIDDWRRHRLVPRMRAAAARRARVAFHDMGGDGLLPADMERVVEALRFDGDARIGVVIQLSPRYLSPAYATEDRSRSRPWMDQIDAGSPLRGGAGFRFGFGAMRDSLPDGFRRPASLLDIARDARLDEPVRRLLHRERVATHFTAPEVSDGNAQVRALRRIVRRLEARGRPALFFATPLNAPWIAPDDQERVRAAHSAWSRILELPAGDSQRLVSFDDEVFHERHFLDHCHLTPAGTDLLARRVVQALGVPVVRPPHAWERPDGASADVGHVVGDAATGHADGTGRRVRFGANADLAVLAPGVLLAADPANRALRHVDAGARLVTTIPHVASLTPGTVAADGAGGAVIVDRETGRLARLRGGALVPLDVDVRWSGDVLLIALAERGVLLHDRKDGRWWHVTGADAPRDLGQIPGALRAAATDAVGGLYALDSLGHLWASRVDRILGGGGFGAAKLLARCDAKRAAAARAARRGSNGYAGAALTGEALALSDPADLVALPEGDGVIVLDRAGEDWHLTFVDPRRGAGYPLQIPGADGIVMDGDRRRLLGAGALALDPHDRAVYWKDAATSALFRLRPARFRRYNWTFGVHADPAAGAITVNGRTLGPRGDALRIAVFGSSLTGSSHSRTPDGSDFLHTGATLPSSLERALVRLMGESPHRVEVADYTTPGARLDEQYVSCLAVGDDVDTAVFVLDRSTFGRRTTDDGPSFVEAWPRLVRDERGRPRVGTVRGFIPAPVLSQESRAPARLGEAVEECVTEMVRYCESRGIRPLFVDVGAVDGGGALTFEPASAATSAAVSAVERTLRSSDRVLIRSDALMDRAGETFPLGVDGDRHLPVTGHRIVGEWLAGRLFDVVQHDAWELTRRRTDQDERRARDVGSLVLPPRVDMPRLEADAAAAAGVADERLDWSDHRGRAILVCEVRAEVTAWRAAVAAFARGAAGRLRQGNDVEVHVVRYRNFDEYGRGVRSSVEFLGRYVIRAPDVAAAAGRAADLLRDAASARPAWLGDR